MPAKIKRIKAQTASTLDLFEFNRPLRYQGGLLGQIKFVAKKSGKIKVRLYQDLDNNSSITKKDLIYRGKITDTKNTDEIIQFRGTIKFKKQIHSCDWAKQKRPDDLIVCTKDYVPTLYELILMPDATGEKIYAKGLGEFSNEELFNGSLW